jgi:hypothetical protein
MGWTQKDQQNVPVDGRAPLWHHPALMSGTRNQFSLTRAASSKWRLVKSKSVYQFSKTMRLLTVQFVVLTLAVLTQLSQLAVKSGNFWGGRGEFLRKLSDWAPRFGLVQT